MTITPLRAAAGSAAVVALAAVVLGTGYAWGSSGTHAVALPATLAAAAGPPGGASPVSTGITVTGTGTVAGTPDTLRLAIGVCVTEPRVAAALDGADGAAARVQASLRQHGVAAADLQTSGVSVQPQYAQAGGKQVITGYQVTESLTATLRTLRTAGEAITAAALAGGDATRIDSVSLDLTDTGPLLTAARAKALRQAKEKAQQYAEAAGVRLGDVVSISETTNSAPAPFAYASGDSAAKTAVPIATGSADVGVTLTAVFGIG